MEPKKVLIAEDDEQSGKLLKEVLTANQYDVTLTSNGLEALEKLKTDQYKIIITDIEMPEMGGLELISSIRDLGIDPVIIVTTVHREAPVIIDVMKKGVYDYIIKPININELLIKIEKAFEMYELRQIKGAVEKERIVRLESQLEWARWKERMESRGESFGSIDKSLFNSLKISFTQGAGFGALITLLNMISSSARKDGSNYIVDAELMDLVTENTKMADKALKTFSEIDWIVSNDFAMEKVSCEDIHKELLKSIDEVSRYTNIKNNTIMISDKKEAFKKCFVEINSEFLRKAMIEIIINAMKFSEKGSNIMILCDLRGTEVAISIISKPWVDEEGREGVPLEYENLVFEPFFRMTKHVYEGYDTLDFGLGLTVVEKIIESHNGKTSISNIKDHTNLSHDPIVKVNFTLTIPVL